MAEYNNENYHPPSMANLSLDTNVTPTSAPDFKTSDIPSNSTTNNATLTQTVTNGITDALPKSITNGPTTSTSNNRTTPPTRPSAPRRTTTRTRTGITFRAPNVNPPEFTAPPLPWLAGTWYFTHSTLPIWRDKRNVRITYTLDSSSTGASNGTSKKQDRLDDVVEYQESGSDKVKVVRGREYTVPGGDTRAWDWRGKGIIKVASSHWEILGWGEDMSLLVPGSSQREEKGPAWMVTFFIKTVFTPAALDFYCRDPDGLSDGAVGEIKEALRGLGDPLVDRLIGELYVCRHDGGKQGKVVDAKGL